jgi:elongation factor Ts
MSVSADDVKQLRAETGAGVMDAKKALAEAKGDREKALALLKERGLAKAAKKSGREASEGLIQSYVHGDGRIGVLIELNCETDFVARNDDFKQLAADIAMQVAALNPSVVTADETPDGQQPEEKALLAQPFIKDPSTTVGDLVTAAISTLGENIQVSRFVRFELGE